MNMTCLFCLVISKLSDKLEVLDIKILKLEALDKSIVLGKETGVVDMESVKNGSVVQINQIVEKVDKLDDMIVRLDKFLEDRDDFQRVKNGSKID